MSIEIDYDSSVSEKILRGVTKTAKIVGTTLGPVGSNVVISKNKTSRFTKDGITVLNSIEFSDHYENVGAELLKMASGKTNTQSGDGTTSTAILAANIFKNGVRFVIDGGNKIKIRDGITKAAERVVSFIKEHSKTLSDKSEIRNVAKISSNHSDEIADSLAEVFSKIGQNGTIKVETGNSLNIESRIVEGMQFDRGYLSPYFATNDKLEAELDTPYIFIIDKKVSNLHELYGPIQAIIKTGKPMLIIANDVDGEALNTLVVNRLRGVQICAVKSPSYGPNQKNMLQDIACLTGGKVISEETGVRLDMATPESGVLGVAKNVVITKDSTTIIGGYGDKEAIAKRIDQLKTQIYNSSDSYETKKLQERLAKLDGGVGIISVGAKTEAELHEKKDLVDDAFCACKAAIAEGIVPGGGVTLLRASKYLSNIPSTEFDSAEDEIGAKILAKALISPIKLILNNAGENADMIVGQLLDNPDLDRFEAGFDVLTNQFGDMFDLEIIDPTKVIISEVRNAASVAGLLLTTNAAIIDIPDPKDAPAQMMPGMVPNMF